MELLFPPYINAAGLLPFVSMVGQPLREEEAVVLDFTHLRRVSPAALAVLVASVVRWRRGGHAVEFRNLGDCAITGYLQRMDVLRHCGVELPEAFSRHLAAGRFVPVREISGAVNEMGDAMAACVAPGGEDFGHPLAALYDFVWYVLTETANNVRQHSGGVGFSTAQASPGEGLVRLAIADNGRGVLGSFRQAGFPWAAHLDDPQAIAKALEPMVSSKGSPTNEGVGLTLTSELARLARGWLLIVSGEGFVRVEAEGGTTRGRLPNGGIYPGTLVALTFKQSSIGDFVELLTRAKVRAGLLPLSGQSGNFSP